MSYTNSTPNLNLPQYTGTDVPTWLEDYNSAMSTIDTKVNENTQNITTAISDNPIITSTTEFSVNEFQIKYNDSWHNANSVVGYFGKDTSNTDFATPFGCAFFENTETSDVTIQGIRISLSSLNFPNGIVKNYKVSCLAYSSEYDPSPDTNNYDMQDIEALFYEADAEDGTIVNLVPANNLPISIKIPKAHDTNAGKLKIEFIGNPIYKA